MTCRRIRRLIPIAAGDDLRPRLAAAVRAHIAGCPGCRSELDAFRAALAAIRAEAGAEGVADWSAGEWRAVMVRVAAEAGPEVEQVRRQARPALKPRWAAAAVAGALLSLVVLGLLFKGPSIPGPAPQGPALAAGTGKTQDQVAIHMVSPESGLQVVWILDRNFEWKGDRN
jgi:hypothetical protein